MSDPIKLPRVSPDELVEGEWYVYNYHCKFIPMIGMFELRNGRKVMANSHDSDCDCMINEHIHIYGPLPKFEIEEQA